MTLKKHGTGEITTKDDQAASTKKTATPDWNDQDQRELEEELRDGDSNDD